MKIQAISDTHGYLPEIPRCDILLIAGDIMPYHDHSQEIQEEFLDNNFRAWLENAPAKDIVWIPGNHDFLLEKEEGQSLARSLPGSFLLDSEANVSGLRIWGTPWITPMPARWAFEMPDRELKSKWKSIPQGLDILVSHAAPFGISDRLQNGSRVGSISLRDNIYKARYTICGHIHEGRGHYYHDTGELWNVSYIDLNYKIVGLPPIIEI